MNRRDLLKRTFQLGAAGLMVPVLEPVRTVWALDRTMVPVTRFSHYPVIGDVPDNYVETGWFDTSPVTWVKTNFSVEMMTESGIQRFPMTQNEYGVWQAEVRGIGVVRGVTYLKVPVRA